MFRSDPCPPLIIWLAVFASFAKSLAPIGLFLFLCPFRFALPLSCCCALLALYSSLLGFLFSSLPVPSTFTLLLPYLAPFPRAAFGPLFLAFFVAFWSFTFSVGVTTCCAVIMLLAFYISNRVLSGRPSG